MPAPPFVRECVNRSCDPSSAAEILKNLDGCAMMSPDDWLEFEDDCRVSFSTSLDHKRSFTLACAKHALGGPAAQLPNHVETLNHVITTMAFLKYFLAPTFSVSTAAGTDPWDAAREFIDQYSSLALQRPKLDGFFLGVPGRNCVWAFFPEAIENHAVEIHPLQHPKVSRSFERLRDRLGLTRSVGEANGFLLFRYPANSPTSCHVPLAVSAGLNPNFRVAPGQAPPHGWTYDCVNHCEGFPEVVHEDMAADRITFVLELVPA